MLRALVCPPAAVGTAAAAEGDPALDEQPGGPGDLLNLLAA
ncbi:hypothetical protein [Actinomycetospora termitidis]|uniref:Uncharacterized protein n=1 Tax=Actinomycetospora termitidis TaxID=3053470 RepID=A0ABT7MKC8_9PSEU|nr:hypothetical protein [Actinomycetospora sp. Odt1-22]MDL5160437.1 hypothetical protein [Actinomycetospora sp. Odt1-22]